MRSHPGRCVQALERIQEVLRAEFDDLAPPDCVFVLSQLLWAFTRSQTGALKEQKKSCNKVGGNLKGQTQWIINRQLLRGNRPPGHDVHGRVRAS
jgi:hypothetical protein